MKENHIIEWATAWLISNDHKLLHAPEIFLETPWSRVIQIATLRGKVWLKQTPLELFLEPQIILLLADCFKAAVPVVLASNENRHCFMMKDAGLSLRQYIKTKSNSELLTKALQEYGTLQRLIENHYEDFFALGVPDWRITNIPTLYEVLVCQTEILQVEGLTLEECELLKGAQTNLVALCERISCYSVKDTIVQPDFHTNNILYDSQSEKLTFIDWGEAAISHPFFALHNFFHQAVIHHGLEKNDIHWCQLEKICLQIWPELNDYETFNELFSLTEKLWTVYAALAMHRLMQTTDSGALQSWYAQRPCQLAKHLRAFLVSCASKN